MINDNNIDISNNVKLNSPRACNVACYKTIRLAQAAPSRIENSKKGKKIAPGIGFGVSPKVILETSGAARGRERQRGGGERSADYTLRLGVQVFTCKSTMRADPRWPAAPGPWCPAPPAPSTSSRAPRLPSPYFPVAAQTVDG